MTKAIRAILYKRGGRNLITRFGPFWTEETYAGRDIGRALFKLNAAAYASRYPNEPAASAASLAFDFTDWRPLSHDDLVVCWKALRVLSYQCDEGENGDLPLSVAMDEALHVLAFEVIEGLEAYKKAPW
jgi:hypothetical protein